MPVPALISRALAAAIVAQLSVAGVVVATGGPSAEAALLERAEILDRAQLTARDVTTAQAGAPVLAAPTAAPAATPAPEPLAPEPPPGPAPAPAPTTTPPATTPPPPPAPPTSTPPPPTNPPPAPRTQTTAAGAARDAACESSMLGWMNEARAGAGTTSLADDPAVDHVAFAWSDHMASTGDLQHNPRYGDQVFAARPEAMTAGEVVGRGPDVRPIFDEFLRSPTHRDAILRRAFTHGTVGCVRDAGGTVWVTANFWG